MLKATWKSLLGRKLRLILSTAAIVLGVAFVAGSLIFTGMLKSTFNEILEGTVADVNVVIEGTYDPKTMSMESMNQTQLTLSPEDVAKLATVDGVESAHGLVSMTQVYPLDKDGKVLAIGGAPAIASNWLAAPSMNHQTGVRLIEGHEPKGPGEVVVDPKTLERSGLSLGQKMKFASPSAGSFEKTVVGTASWGNGGSAGAMYSFFSDSEAQRLFLDNKIAYQSGWVVTKPDADPVTVAQAIAKVLPEGYEAVDGKTVADAQASVMNKSLDFVNIFLMVFAAIGMLVATILIVNTFSILVAQRSRELALFRAMGASKEQVRNTVLLEALIIGLIGATLGLFLGWLLALGIVKVMSMTGMDIGGRLPVPGLDAVIASYAVGILVTMASAWLPARAASAVPPVAAMTGAVTNADKGLGKRIVLGGAMVVSGAVAMGLGTWVLDSRKALVVGIGAAVVLLGTAAASPWLGRPVTWTLGAVYRKVFGEIGKLAELNAARQPRRTAATASALMLSLALVSTLAVLGASMARSMDSLVRESLRGDLLVESATYGNFPHSIAEQTEQIDGVAGVHVNRGGLTARGDERTWLVAQDPASFDKVIAQKLVSGRQPSGTNEVIVQEGAAREWGIAEGQTIDLLGLAKKPVKLTVVGLFSVPEGGGVGNLVVNLTTGENFLPPNQDMVLTIDLDEGADVAAVRKQIDLITKDLPMVKVMDTDEVVANRTSQVNALLNIIYALLGLAVVISILGIVNTLGLSIVERTREIGLLRAIALTRGELRRMITLESVVIALLGSILGVTLGVVFGVALQHTLAEKGLSKLVVPWDQLAAFLAVAALVGVLAALWPAFRASRLDVLDAIAHE